MRNILRCLAPLLACGCAHLHSPAGPVIPDRPGFTDTPTVLPAGSVQVETGFTSDRADGTTYQAAGELLVRLGVGGPLELRLFGNSYANRSAPGQPSARGMEDTKLGAKLRMIEKPDSVHGFVPNLAVIFATTLPTGASGIGAGSAQPEAKLAASWTTPSPVSIYTNAGFGAVPDGAGWVVRGWGTAAAWYAVNPRLSLFLEGLSQNDVSGPPAPARYVDGGFTLMISERFQIDARIGRGSARSIVDDRFFGIGMARRF